MGEKVPIKTKLIKLQLRKTLRDKVFKNGPSEICGRQP